MYLKRKIDAFLREWKQDAERLPLIIKGSRQVGKTESVRHFAEENYPNFIEINFVEEPKYRTILMDGYQTDKIMKNISLVSPDMQFPPGKTLLFFDEVQSFPDIATSLKFFRQDGRFDVICSGSLLGIHYKQIESNSVGYKTDYIMHSMDFEEFLWARGYQDDLAEELYGHMVSGTPLGETLFQACHGLFLDYVILGGMPAVVRQFVRKKTFEGTLAIQKQLLVDYEEDIRKYAEGLDQTRILNVYRHIPVQLAKENKKFQISKVASGSRFKDYRGCVEWLGDSGLVNLCYCLNFPELPLKGNYDDSKYKIYMNDTGLLVASLDEEASEDLRVNRNLNVYKGALYENLVAEALVKSGYSLFYYKRENSTLEEDFFVRTATELVPVEVKSVGGRSKSLRTLLDSEKYDSIHWGIKLSHGNIGYSNGIYTFPYFCAFLLRRFLRER